MSRPSVIPPALTDAQRHDAARRSLEVRRSRAALKAALAQGRFWPSTVWGFPDAQGMKVYTLLLAIPGIGQAKAQRMMQEAGIPADSTVRGCGPVQTAALFATLHELR